MCVCGGGGVAEEREGKKWSGGGEKWRWSRFEEKRERVSNQRERKKTVATMIILKGL